MKMAKQVVKSVRLSPEDLAEARAARVAKGAAALARLEARPERVAFRAAREARRERMASALRVSAARPERVEFYARREKRNAVGVRRGRDGLPTIVDFCGLLASPRAAAVRARGAVERERPESVREGG